MGISVFPPSHVLCQLVCISLRWYYFAMILVSTSGFSYKDWAGPFYPEGTPKQEMFSFFAQFFPAVELNYSYYSIPSKRGIDSFLQRAPGMKFALKAHKSFTHRREYGRKEIDAFHSSLDQLGESNALISLLLQFPYSFHANRENLDYIDKLTEEFSEYPVAVEFRHGKWKNQEAFDLLKKKNLALVTTDAPAVGELFRGGWENIGPFGYVRLHGRNAEKWYDHEHAWERYNYLYSPEQIDKIADAVNKLSGEGGEEQEKRDVYVFFNNHWQAQGVINALQLRMRLGQELPAGLPRAIIEKLS